MTREANHDNPASVVGVPWNENGYVGAVTTCLCPHDGLSCCDTEGALGDAPDAR